MHGRGFFLDMKIDIFDTTLRDGFQQEGISPSVKDKLAIAKLLDDLGVTFIAVSYTHLTLPTILRV